MDRLNTLYNKWFSEKNKGHYKEKSDRVNDLMSLFANQDFVLQELEKLFAFYNLQLKGNILDIGCSMGGFMYSLYNSTICP